MPRPRAAIHRKKECPQIVAIFEIPPQLFITTFPWVVRVAAVGACHGIVSHQNLIRIAFDRVAKSNSLSHALREYRRSAQSARQCAPDRPLFRNL